MSTLRAFHSGNQAVTSMPVPGFEASSLPWDALINNLKNDFETANTVVESILTVPERCQVTPFYIQAVIAKSSVFLISNTGNPDSLHLTKSGACWVLGQSTTCDLPVRNVTVDSCHAVIHHTPEAGFSIADIGSQTGTCLNRRRLELQKRRQLRDGDMIELGNLVVEFFVDNFDRFDDPLEGQGLEYPDFDTTYTGMDTLH